MSELDITVLCYLWVGVSALLCKRYLHDCGTVTSRNWWKSLLLWPVECAMVLFRDRTF